jgi:hypothetical protein
MVLAAGCTDLAAAVVTFEDLSLAGDTSENGTGLSPYGTGTSFGSEVNLNRFTSGGITFENRYTPDFGSWERWAYSNLTDTTTQLRGDQ